MKGFFLFCALYITLSSALNPGISIALLQNTVDGIKRAFYYYLKTQLLTQPINDINTNGYTLTNIRILEFTEDPDDFAMNLGDKKFDVDADNFGFRASMNAMKPNTFNEPMQVVGNDCEIKFNLVPNWDQNALKLSYSVTDVVVSLDGLQATATNPVIEGTANNLLDNNDFVDNLQNNMAASIQTSLTNALNTYATNFPNSVPIPYAPLALSTKMTNAPFIESDYMAMFFDGTVFTPSQGEKVLPIPGPVQLPQVHPSDDRSAQMFVSDYVFNSALYETWTHNGIEFVMTDDMLPAQSSLRLTTDSMNTIFPGLVDKYGTGKKMAVDCMDLGGSPPTMQSTNGQLVGTVSGFCDLYVIETPRWKRALTVAGTMVSAGAISIVNGQPLYTIETINFSNVDVPETTLPPLDNSAVQTGLNNGVASWLPYSKPVPLVLLPQDQIVNPGVRHHDGYTEVLYDIAFPDFSATGTLDTSKYLGFLGYQ